MSLVMSLRERIFDRFFGDIYQARLSARLEAMREAVGRTREDDGFRRLTAHPDRDLAPVTLDRQREIAVFLWTYNPIGRRIIETIVEWIVGEGAMIDAPNPETKAYLQRFWDHPVNRWDLKLPSRVRELYLFGEQFWPAFQNQFDGRLTLAALDPSRVSEVVTDPDNCECPIGVIVRARGGSEERRFRTMLRGEAEQILSNAALAERERFRDGELFLFQVNKLAAATRGISELFVLADWLDGYEDLLFSILQQEKVRSQFLWDVTIQGATQEEIEKRMKEIRPPKPLSIRMHNEKEQWQLVGPAFGSAVNNAETARLFRNHMLGGASIPEHWYGGGGDVNRATAAEMGAPTEKALTAKQKTVRYVLEDVCAVQIERGLQTGALRESDDVREFSVTLPDLSPRDISRIAPALQQLSAALSLGKSEGWISDEIAVRVLASTIAHLGVEVDAERMLEEARSSLADQVAAEFDRRLRVVGDEP